MPSVNPVVERVFERARGKAELYIALGRALLTALALTRFFAVGSLGHAGGPLRALVAVPLSLAALALSIGIVTCSPRRRNALVLSYVTVLCDGLLAFGALLANVLWPWQGYQGILKVPDGAAFIIVTLAAGLRMSRPVAIVGWVVNVVLMAVLVVLDLELNAVALPAIARDATMTFIHLTVAGAGAVLFAVHSRRLAETAARESVRAESARDSLQRLLEEHHHLRSALSAVAVHAEHIVRRIGAPSSVGAPGAVPDDIVELAGVLRAEISATADMLAQVDGHADAARVAAAEPSTVNLRSSLVAMQAVLARRFPTMTVRVDVPAEPTLVNVTGGASVLERVLLHLAMNAAEGDGERGATELAISTETTGDSIVVRVRDNGPGLGKAESDWLTKPSTTTKRNGSGLGLYFVATVMMASGGELVLGKRSARPTEVDGAGVEGEGCEAVLRLPRARSAPE